jgi:hypothetical protein
MWLNGHEVDCPANSTLSVAPGPRWNPGPACRFDFPIDKALIWALAETAEYTAGLGPVSPPMGRGIGTAKPSAHTLMAIV